MGEISTTCYVDIPRVVRDTIREIGYDRAKYGFDCDTCAVLTSIDEQSPDIALGVDSSLERKAGAADADLAIGAGDQLSLIHIFQAERDADCAIRHGLTARLAHALELFELPFIQVGQLGLLCAAERPFAAVARDEPPPAAEIVDRQAAVVLAQAAARGFDRVAEMGKHVHANQRGFSGTVVLGVQRGAVCAHQAGDRGTRCV